MFVLNTVFHIALRMCGAYPGCFDETKLGEQTLNIRSLLNILTHKIWLLTTLQIDHTLLFHYSNKILKDETKKTNFASYIMRCVNNVNASTLYLFINTI